MDPSKFSVRVTKPTMIRQERFLDSAYPDITKTMFESMGYHKFEKAPWCAPRKTNPVGSSLSVEDDSESSENELYVKKLARKHRRTPRVSQHEKRIKELSRPRRLSRSHGVNSIETVKQSNNAESISQTDATVKPSGTIEKYNHRQLTDRIAKLAEPKFHEPLAVNTLGKVDERALFAVGSYILSNFINFTKKLRITSFAIIIYFLASKRITELAIPKNCPSMQNSRTEKLTAFGVKEQATKAICSPRIEFLSRSNKTISQARQFSTEDASQHTEKNRIIPWRF